jgi:hypothetical protein
LATEVKILPVVVTLGKIGGKWFAIDLM